MFAVVKVAMSRDSSIATCALDSTNTWLEPSASTCAVVNAAIWSAFNAVTTPVGSDLASAVSSATNCAVER